MAMQAGANQPEPVLKAQLITIATAVVGLLIAFGVHVTSEQRVAIIGAISAMVPLVALAAAWRSRSLVTPLASPHDADGAELVRQDGTAPLGMREPEGRKI
jgi:hypothetical protein